MNCERYPTRAEFKNVWEKYLEENSERLEILNDDLNKIREGILEHRGSFFVILSTGDIYFSSYNNARNYMTKLSEEYRPAFFDDIVLYRAFLIQGAPQEFYNKSHERIPSILEDVARARKGLLENIIETSDFFLCPQAALYNLVEQSLDYIKMGNCFIYISAYTIDDRYPSKNLSFVEEQYALYKIKTYTNETKFTLSHVFLRYPSGKEILFPDNVTFNDDDEMDFFDWNVASGIIDNDIDLSSIVDQRNLNFWKYFGSKIMYEIAIEDLDIDDVVIHHT